MNFEAVIDGVIAREKGYVDDPNDRGGPTNYGITVAVARQNGYFGDMRELPVALARNIYRNRYIVEPAFDKVALVDEGVAAELIDTGVNMGPGSAAQFFQRLLNCFNVDGSKYSDVFVDGRVGDVTVSAFRVYMRWRGAEGAAVMCEALNDLQGSRYVDLAEKDHSQRKFFYGWIKERVMKPAMA